MFLGRNDQYCENDNTTKCTLHIQCDPYVHPWWIHVNVWQNQYSIVKQNKVKIKILKIKKKEVKVKKIINKT